jgi:hypothetical protein
MDEFVKEKRDGLQERGFCDDGEVKKERKRRNNAQRKKQNRVSEESVSN